MTILKSLETSDLNTSTPDAFNGLPGNGHSSTQSWSLSGDSRFSWPGVLKPWDVGSFRLVNVLHKATESWSAHLELYEHRIHPGTRITVKRFPKNMLFATPDEFKKCGGRGNPWQEIFLGWEFQRIESLLKAPAPVLPAAMYQDKISGDIILSSEKVLDMDLADYCQLMGKPGLTRSTQACSLLKALLRAVMALHAMDVHHGTIRTETIWMHKNADDDWELSLTNFGTPSPTADPYQAPEAADPSMGKNETHAADLFACGVVGFVLATGRFPWFSTGAGRSFKYAKDNGIRRFLRHSYCPTSKCEMPHDYRLLLESLLHFDPAERVMKCHKLRFLIKAPEQAPLEFLNSRCLAGQLSALMGF